MCRIPSSADVSFQPGNKLIFNMAYLHEPNQFRSIRYDGFHWDGINRQRCCRGARHMPHFWSRLRLIICLDRDRSRSTQIASLHPKWCPISRICPTSHFGTLSLYTHRNAWNTYKQIRLNFLQLANFANSYAKLQRSGAHFVALIQSNCKVNDKKGKEGIC